MTTDSYTAATAKSAYFPEEEDRIARLWSVEKIAQDLAAFGAISLFEGAGSNPTGLSGYSTSKLWLNTASGVTDSTGTIRYYDGAGNPALLASWPALSVSGFRSHLIGEVSPAAFTFKPVDYGGVGNGIADDTDALNGMFTAVRAHTAAAAIGISFASSFVVDLRGMWKVTDTINATGINAWNLQIQDGLILGHCTGVPVLDLVGSRGYSLVSTMIIGDATNTPSVGIQTARSSENGHCDSCRFEKVIVMGSFSEATALFYAQESCVHLHCQYYNDDWDAYTAVFQGIDDVAMDSPSQTVVSGAQSYINNKYISCIFGNTQGDAGTGGATYGTVATATATNPAVIGFANHPYSNGDTVCFASLAGGTWGTELNQTVKKAANVTANTFELFETDGITSVDATGFGTYTGSSGQVFKAQTKSTVLISRAYDHTFDSCYITVYGQPAIQLNLETDVAAPLAYKLSIDALVEGAAVHSHLFFGVATTACTVYGLKLSTYNSAAVGGFMASNATGGGGVTIYDLDVSVSNHRHLATLQLFDDFTKFTCYGADIDYPNSGGVSGLLPAQFVGSVRTHDGTYPWSRIGGTMNGTVVGGVTPAAGTFTSVRSAHATLGIGYGTGAGGTVTQGTSKSTTVSLSKVCGAITMHNAALAADAIVSFTLTNSAIAAGDVLVLNHISGGTIGAYNLNAQCGAGSATVNVTNVSAGSLGEAIVIQFAVVKAVSA